MDIKAYIAAELERGQTMEDIMSSITASANAAEKEYEAAKVKVKNYSQPLRNDKEIIDAIIADEVTAGLLADICLYWFDKESHGIFTGLTPKEVDTVRSDLAKELKSLALSFARFSKIMSDDSKSDFDKLCLMTNELIDMGLTSKSNRAKEKIKSDSERINDMMRKLGF